MDADSLRRYSSGADGPSITVDWYEAAAYCNWLSKKERLSENEWCYGRNAEGVFGEGMKIRADALNRTGYRLPTEAEWEYACRAGAVTARYYGNSTELLPKYAWYQSNSDDRSWPTASLLPNDLGLFDTLGNVYEWSQDRNAAHRFVERGAFRDLIIDEVVTDQQQRMYRGGAFVALASEARPAGRGADFPTFVSFMFGFRVARTVRESP